MARVRAAIAAALLLVLVPSPARPAGAEERKDFSFYGVTFGMTREQIGAVWMPLSDGTFAVAESALKKVEPRFDRQGRMYELSFSVELDLDDPPVLVNRAFQNVVESRWTSAKDLDVSLTLGRESHLVVVSDRARKLAYTREIEEKIAPLLGP